MTIPPEAQAAVDAILLALKPKKGRRVVVVINGYRHPDGKVDVSVDVDGEKFRHAISGLGAKVVDKSLVATK